MLQWIKKGLQLLAVFLAAFLVGSNAWVWSAGWGRLATSPAEVPAGSVLLLLGTDEFVAGTHEETGTFRPRIESAEQLCKSGRIKFVISSGTEAHAITMADQLRAAGVTCPIVEDPYGWRTLDSVLRAKAYYPKEHIVFVSQGWHCVRALWLAEHEGLSASAYPSGFGTGYRAYQATVRDVFAKPKAVIDRYIFNNPLLAPVPAGEGNRPHR
ncbi:MAG: ElyC/SanA/YdcF family protein [Verrucomicrobiota bacterium]|jgi:SanA protein